MREGTKLRYIEQMLKALNSLLYNPLLLNAECNLWGGNLERVGILWNVGRNEGGS